MTSVKLLYKRIDGATLEGVPITDGSVAFWPVRQRNTAGGLLTTVADQRPIGSTISLAPDSYYFQLIDVSDGRGDVLRGPDAVTCRVVPPTGGPYEIDDLEIGNPAPVGDLPPDWQLWVADYVATQGGGGGGGSFPTPSQIIGSTAVGQAMIVASDKAAGRAAIDAGTSSLVIGTSSATAKAGNYAPDWATGITGRPSVFPPDAHEHPVAEIDATGVASSSNFLRGDGSWTAPTIANVTGLADALTGIGNAVFIDGFSAARTHPVTGVALPLPPACVVGWITHNATGRPPAAVAGDIVLPDWSA